MKRSAVMDWKKWYQCVHCAGGGTVGHAGLHLPCHGFNIIRRRVVSGQVDKLQIAPLGLKFSPGSSSTPSACAVSVNPALPCSWRG